MDYIKSFEKAIIYIEENLNEDFKAEDVAKSIGYSYYHFTRLFEGLLGENVGNYIRKRRMAKAAQDLLYTDKNRILVRIDILMKFGITQITCSPAGATEVDERDLARIFDSEFSASSARSSASSSWWVSCLYFCRLVLATSS